MSSDLSAPRIAEWKRWYLSGATDPTYRPKALLAILEADGIKMLVAVLRELKITRPEQIIEAMRDTPTATLPSKNASDRPRNKPHPDDGRE